MTERLYRTMVMVQLDGTPHASALGSGTPMSLDKALHEAKRLLEGTAKGEMPHKEHVVEITFVVLRDDAWRERFTEVGSVVFDIPSGAKPH